MMKNITKIALFFTLCVVLGLAISHFMKQDLMSKPSKDLESIKKQIDSLKQSSKLQIEVKK